jgi:thiol-disulfide isomerase/thioredoxin
MDFSTLPKLSRAPEFAGLGPWHNSEPFSLESLRGKVVLVDFWTYSCINCIRTLPHIQRYWEKFNDMPFVLIGVHTPEFTFEKLESNVADAIKRHALTYPIAQDNDFETWNAFANRYWPAKYLIDAEGYIRYTHFGEGAYEETDRAIQSLLAEIAPQNHNEGESAQSTDQERTSATEYRPEPAKRFTQSPETYLGERSWPSFGNGPAYPMADPRTYEAPSSMELHKYYLVGEWQLRESERQVLLSTEGEIRMKFLGSEINVVLGLEKENVMLSRSEPVGEEQSTKNTSSVQADVDVDGKHVQSFTIDKNDLFTLYKGAYGEHEIILRLHGAGVAGYAFTFGAQ